MPFAARWLDDGDLDALYALHDKVVRNVDHPHMFRADTRAFMAKQLDRRGRTVGAFVGEAIVAYAAISFPDADPDNLGRDLPLTAQQLDRVADYDGSAVDPTYRGNGLQRLLSEIRNAYALSCGRHHILGTVSPLNPVSLANFLKLGFRVRGLKPKYGGALRYLIHRDLAAEPPALAPTGEAIAAPMADIALQETLLGEGLVGIEVLPGAGGPRLCFVREAALPAARAA